MTLTEFLRHRINEDAAYAHACHVRSCTQYLDFNSGCTCYVPAQMLAECAVKRAWVSEYERWSAAPGPQAPIIWAAMRGPMHHLAAIYADHADYRQEWKP